MLKWRLLISTLPIVAAVLALKFLLSNGFHFRGWIEFTDIALVLTGGVFLIGFMLAGTMADYKESERIPAELAAQCETLEDCLEQAIVTSKNPVDATAVRTDYRNMVDSIYGWFMKKQTQAEMFDSLHSMVMRLQYLEKNGSSGSAVGKMLGDVDKIRKLVTRAGVISRTGFLQTGYALLEMLICLILCLLMIASFKGWIAQVVVITFITLIYVYMYRLIKDVDNPFDYSPDGKGGCSEVPLFPITEYMDRLDHRTAARGLQQQEAVSGA